VIQGTLGQEEEVQEERVARIACRTEQVAYFSISSGWEQGREFLPPPIRQGKASAVVTGFVRIFLRTPSS